MRRWLAILVLGAALPGPAAARESCILMTVAGADGWGTIHCFAVDRPRDRPARLRR